MQHLAVDTETTGLNPYLGARMFAFSTCSYRGDTGVYRMERAAKAGEPERAKARLENLFDDRGRRTVSKVFHNARFDLDMIRHRLGIPLAELRKHDIHETMALSHLVQNLHPSHALDQLAWEYFSYARDLDNAVAKYKRSENAMLSCPEWLCEKYQRADAERTMLLFRGLSKKVREMGLWDIYEVERKLVWTTLAIQDRGMMLDVPRCEKLIVDTRKKAEQALEDFQAIAGSGSRITDNQIRGLLYGKRGLGLKPRKRTRTGLPSVDKTVLAELRRENDHPIFEPIARYKSYTHGAAILEGYLELVDANDIIHPNIHPYRAATSRQACTQPNLHNVETTTALRNPYPVAARRVFRPKPGHVNYLLDYSGIEMRGLVGYSRDAEFLRIFAAGEDPHAEAAKELYGKRFTGLDKKRHPKKWKALRDAAKNGNFELCYGGGLATLAHTLGMSVEDTRPGHERFKRRFKEQARLNKRDSAEARTTGCGKTFFGRILHVPRNKPYALTNYKVQGGSAGLLKRAEIDVEKVLDKHTGGECGIIITIHDELLIECPRKRMRDFEGDTLPRVIEAMTHFDEVGLPLEVEVEIATRDWENTEEVEVT